MAPVAGNILTGGRGGYLEYRGDSYFFGGKGGDLGQAGQQGETINGGAFPGANGGAGGQPGNAIDGISFVTYVTRGDIRGTEV